MDHDQLVEELKRHLAEKRYILLIDDIWSAKTRESIRICMPENYKGSRIIVTTRFQAAGATCSQGDRIDLLHTIGLLNGDDSKRLFDQSVSESRSSRHSEKVQDQFFSEEIWKICRGLPLAIVTIAGLVACNPSRSEVCRSLFPDPVDHLTLDGVTRILDCCYNDLPGDLKTCSLYLSIFPKGWKISRKRLTRRWIAEGFVSEKQGLTEQEVAETYFNQLMRRKIIRPVALELSGKLERPPKWITKLHTLNKLTLPVTVLRTDTLELLCDLSSLFSLTFSLSAAKQDQGIEYILERNKSQSDGEIFVPGGFQSLKLLRFFAPLVPKLGFSDNTMPALEMIEMRFEAFEGLFGIDTLKNLTEVHLRVNDQSDETTKFFVDDLKNNTYIVSFRGCASS